MGGPVQSRDWDPIPPPERTAESWLRWANELPFCRALGLVTSELGDGRLTAGLERAPVVANPNGSVHGGLQVALADHCMGMAAIAVLPPGFLAVTASVHASYHRPAVPPLTLRGFVRSSGRTLVHVDVDVFDSRNRLCTSAHGTMAVVDAETVTNDAGG